MHPVPDSKPACRGYSLVEILVFIAVFSMALVMLSKLFVTTSRLSVYSTQIVDRMNAVREVQRDFAEVVRGAVAIVPSIGEHHTGEDTLVLQLHHEGGPERYVVLSMFDGQQHLCLLEVTGEENELQADKYVTWRLPVAAIHFEMDNTKRQVTLVMNTQTPNPQKPEGGRIYKFVATLRANYEGGGL